MHTVRYCILEWKKLKYAGATHAKHQNVEATQKYNNEMKAWIADNIISDGVFFDVVFIDPSKAVDLQQANAIGEAKSDAAMHFRTSDGTHPGHMPNVANAQILFNSMYQSKMINRAANRQG